MIVHINRDTLVGCLLALLGAFIATYAFLLYPMGDIARMGPGMFPVMMGVILFLIAVAIIVVSLVQASEPVAINVRSASVILLGLAVFAILVDPFGVVPAMMALLLISSVAVPGRRPVGTVLFSLVVTACVVFIFSFLLSINLKLFGWPA